MPVTRIGKFLEFEDLGITPSLGVESEISNKCITEVVRRDIRGVFGSPCFGFTEQNLDFLESMPNVEQVWFWEIALKNIEGLYFLKNLRYFGVHEKRSPIDFSQLPNLKQVVWHPVQKDRGVEMLTGLINLDIWRFKSPSKSYKDLLLPESVEI